MSEEARRQPWLRKTEIVIAVIGLIGVIATGVLSNWEKIFAKGEVLTATYEGYSPTGNFETEFRYFFEVSGNRAMSEQLQEQMLKGLEVALISQEPQRAEEIKQMVQAFREEALTFDEIRERILPIYKKHFTIEELQELNRFYSTKVMQAMVAKTPLLAQEIVPIQMALMKEVQERVFKRMKETSPESGETPTP